MKINSLCDGIKVEGFCGTWHVIGSETFKEKEYFLLEHEELSDEKACIIVDENCKLILDSVWNGFGDLEYFWKVTK